MASAAFTLGSVAGKAAPEAREEQPAGPQLEQKPAPQAPARGSWLAAGFRDFVSKTRPTNYGMLLFRTVNRDLMFPNCNEDHIAPLFRDKLMPFRGLVNRTFGPSMLQTYKNGVEDPQYGVPGVCNFVDARTKWLDGALKAALDEGVEQVVCIAAGFDTRAYRFARKGVTFFEVDLPWASQKKQALVKSCLPSPEVLPRPTYVGADLSKVTLGEALEGTGFDPARPSFFCVEGLIYYLPREAVAKLISSVAGLAAPGSRLAFDFLRADALDGSVDFSGYQNCAYTCALKNEPFISALEPDAAAMKGYLASLGFSLHRVWTGKEMVAAQLPHETWSDARPPILDFYCYCEAARLDEVQGYAPRTRAAPEAGREAPACAPAGHEAPAED